MTRVPRILALSSPLNPSLSFSHAHTRARTHVHTRVHNHVHLSLSFSLDRIMRTYIQCAGFCGLGQEFFFIFFHFLFFTQAQVFAAYAQGKDEVGLEDHEGASCVGEGGIAKRASAVWSLMADGRAPLEHPEHPATFGSSCQLPDLLTGLPPLRNAYEVLREREGGRGTEREREREKAQERERKGEKVLVCTRMCTCVRECGVLLRARARARTHTPCE